MRGVRPSSIQICQEMLETKEGVVGYSEDMQKKLVGGVAVDVDAIRLYVEKKKPLSALAEEDVIPSEIEGVPTDVVEVGKIVAEVNRRGKHRPAPGGVSVGHYGVTAGTLSVAVDNETNQLVNLSNNHVFANSDYKGGNKASYGDVVLQPGVYDGGRLNRDDYARLERWVKLNRGGVNLVDCAIATPLDPDDLDPRILDESSQPTLSCVGYETDLRVGDTVEKSGRTSGYSQGVVRDMSFSGVVGYDIGTLFFTDQILTTNMSAGGDSGSLTFVRKRGDEVAAVGLVFAGSNSVTLHNKIANVMARLNVGFDLIGNKPPNPPTELRCEGMENPSELRTLQPKFSWKFSDPDAGDSQSAYRIVVNSEGRKMWDTGKVRSTGNNCAYAGAALKWGSTYTWTVRTWDAEGSEGAPSEGRFSTSVLPEFREYFEENRELLKKIETKLGQIGRDRSNRDFWLAIVVGACMGTVLGLIQIVMKFA